ncbi:methyl-accepting chemotaxis protein [Allopseudospirillum japonicum]|uniref:Methyl-accepting chemotaxis protein n=1 Tax=Allopseudospirillum japonicum TaxID=64971 RepID=A0A1H6S7Q0_9GAMM|nr:methyl-accepting chemotaxis protein [Allopseudospirillum japonicum]SEI60060.1 methyl-accepting chemotaxis protein [Allopseudospirillum japonicum]
MTLAQRLYLGFGLIVAFMIAVTSVGVVKVSFIDNTLTQVNDENTVKQRFAINFRGSVHDRAIAIRDAVLVTSTQKRQVFLQDIQQLDDFYQEAAQGMARVFAQPKGASTQEKNLLQQIQKIEQQTLKLTEQTLALLAQEQHQQAQSLLMEQVSPAYTAWLNAINTFIDHQEAQIQQQVTQVHEETSGFQNLMLIVTALAILVSVLVSYQLVSSLTRTIGGEPEEAADLIRRVAAGDLSTQVQTPYPDSIMGAVATTTQYLAQMIREVTTSAHTLAESAANMKATAERNQALVIGQREQTEMGATAMNQMSATVQEVAGHTVEAANVARAADEETLKGDQEVKRTIASIQSLAQELESAAKVIDALSQDSTQIGTVLEVIETIAEQTNLLALNAAIEAARAGEHGRGFAVVADEVRGLASRTQESTRDIQQRIEKMQTSAQGAVKVMELSRNQAAASVEQAQRAGDSLQLINTSVASINNMNTQIASAAEEQSAVAEEINRNFAQITQAAEQAAAGVQQNVAASQELSQLANRLLQSVQKFRV